MRAVKVDRNCKNFSKEFKEYSNYIIVHYYRIVNTSTNAEIGIAIDANTNDICDRKTNANH